MFFVTVDIIQHKSYKVNRITIDLTFLLKYALIFTGKLLFPKSGLNPMAPLIRITAIENVINIDLLYPFAINSTMY